MTVRDRQPKALQAEVLLPFQSLVISRAKLLLHVLGYKSIMESDSKLAVCVKCWKRPTAKPMSPQEQHKEGLKGGVW